MSQKYADIIIDISHEAVDRSFQYIIPEQLEDCIDIGSPVDIPFGKGNRTRKGYVIRITEKPDYDVTKLKEISALSKKGIRVEENLIKLAVWMKNRYGCTMATALATVMPVKESVRKVATRVEEQELEIDNPPVMDLNEEQSALVEEFTSDLNEGKCNTYLLKGVTGSGKTEVYISCIKEVIKQGRQAIVLIPEIGLTYQNVSRFKQHFGNRIAVFNSKQSKGEKYRELEKVKQGEADVVIGPRSALFSPFAKLGLIVIDEEHDDAYKSEQTPRYHAREVALKRAQIENCPVILGSATPSLESYMRARQNIYRLWTLNARAKGATLSEVSIVDMRDELHKGNRSIVSTQLASLIEDRLQRKEQIMLFINRRGYNSFVSCRECGDAIMCPKCDVSLSLHGNGRLMCHYCGYTMQMPKECPSCKSKMIAGFGTGTQKVEEEINKLFPSAKTIRMDRDTTERKGAYADILSKLSKGKADILIGTQMIVKGHDFENVTLVGVMLADLSLFSNDYRAGERTFDLLTQAAGRAGRGDKKGHVVIQSYQPDNYAICTAVKQQYEEFYEFEISYRRMMKYPPCYDMLAIMITSPDYELAVSESEHIAKYVKNMTFDEKVFVIGPSDAQIAKINDIYRRVIYIKLSKEESAGQITESFERYEHENVNIIIDINPNNM